jgi:hypothetical protein
MTAPDAAGILEEYSTFRELMEAYETYEKRGKNPELLLKDCRVSWRRTIHDVNVDR